MRPMASGLRSVHLSNLCPRPFRRGFLMLLFPVRLGQYRDRLKLFLLKASVDRGQFFVRQLTEIRDHVLEFMAKGIATDNLVISRPAFVTVYVSVQLTEVFADTLFAGNRSAFLGRHDPGTEVSQVGRQLLELTPKRVFLSQLRRARQSGIAH